MEEEEEEDIDEDDFDDIFDDIFKNWTQKDKVEFAISTQLDQLDDIKRVIKMKRKQTYKR